MGHTDKFKPEEVVADYTEVVSKLWDNVMPTHYPHILDFKTNKVLEVKHVERMGPYSMTEHFIHHDVNVLIDNSPLVDIGWNGVESISNDMVKRAYGDNYFYDMRNEMLKLLQYVGINFSHFDFGGPIHASVKDL